METGNKLEKVTIFYHIRILSNLRSLPSIISRLAKGDYGYLEFSNVKNKKETLHIISI